MFLGPSTAHKLMVNISAAGDLRFSGSRVAVSSATPPVPDGSNMLPLLAASLAGSGDADLALGIASVVSRIEEFTLLNNSSSVVPTVRFKRTDGTNTPPGPGFILLPQEWVSYAAGIWTHYDANGGIYGAGSSLQAQSVLVSPLFATGGLTSTKTITSASCFALYLGRLTRPISSAQIRYQVTTAMATITWGELAIAKGAVNPGGNPTLTVVGYADISAVANSTGRKTTVVNVSAGQALSAGDDLWVIVGNQATTAAQLRACSMADDNQLGLQASVASRPSTIVGTPTAFTIEGAAVLPAWLAALV